jgi:formate dehydrogenase major subunit
MVMGMANLAMATGNIGRVGVGVNPLARPEQRAGRLRHGLASRTSCPGYRHISDDADARAVRGETGA